jgi:mRNA interferase MazF
MSYPHRGDVYWVSLDPVVGTEIAKTRPAVVISNNIGNELSARVIVAPITSGGIERVYPFEVLVLPSESGLQNPSKVVLDQIRTIDKQRLGRRIGALSVERMRDVDQAIRRSLSV